MADPSETPKSAGPAVAESGRLPATPLAFRQVYDQHFAFVWRALYRLGVPERDLPDAAQDTFLAVHRQLSGFEGRSKLTTWLFGICFRIARSRGRRAHLRREVLDGDNREPQSDAPGAECAIEQQRDLELLGRVLDRMELDDRAVFTLFELEGLTGREIAELLELPLGTVYSKLRKARALIEEQFERAGRRTERAPDAVEESA
jgi:RNA polymerase sigma-70 factor (ECF subfamily)